jgi:TetR/AcrR family transcriptional regulator
MRARGKETRQAILRAAEQVFAERGYAGARMDDVAAEVGIKRASMVYYFRDKRSLYVALLDDLYGELGERYRRVAAESSSLRDSMFGFLDAWATHVAERPGSVRILMWESARIRRASADPLAEQLQPLQATIIDVIHAGQRDGIFRPIDPMRFIMIITGATAFLTLGLGVLRVEAEPLTPAELRTELRSLVQRILIDD